MVMLTRILSIWISVPLALIIGVGLFVAASYGIMKLQVSSAYEKGRKFERVEWQQLVDRQRALRESDKIAAEKAIKQISDDRMKTQLKMKSQNDLLREQLNQALMEQDHEEVEHETATNDQCPKVIYRNRSCGRAGIPSGILRTLRQKR